MQYPKFVWWVGFIEEIYDDPLKLGRVRVRAVGYHPPKDTVPTSELPLALILNGGTSKINIGDMVLGFFLDGPLAQQPVVMGGIGSAVSNSSGRFFGSISQVASAVAQSFSEVFQGEQPPESPASVDKEFWTLVALASKEALRGDSQGQVDVAQSVYNRVGAAKAGAGYGGPNTISGKILAKNQYEPTFRNPSQWSAIKDAKTAAIASNLPESYMIEVAQNIQNPSFQKSASSFIQGRTDFLGGGQPANAAYSKGTLVCRDPRGTSPNGDIRKTARSNKFGWAGTYNDNIVYPVPDYIRNYKIQ